MMVKVAKVEANSMEVFPAEVILIFLNLNVKSTISLTIHQILVITLLVSSHLFQIPLVPLDLSNGINFLILPKMFGHLMFEEIT